MEDTTAPAVTVPGNITKEATSAAGATATFDASASDTVDGSVATTCDPASGSTFALGSTTVICSATDAAGNTGTDSFNVTVQDTTAPAVTVPANEVAEATGPNGAKVVYGDVSASDIVDGPMNPSCSQASDTVFPLGTTTVTCTRDRRRRQQGHQLLHGEGGRHHGTRGDRPRPTWWSATPPQPAPTTSSTPAPLPNDLVSGDLPVTCTPASGSTFALGINTVTCTATDAAGNTGTATFTIEVQDQTKPTVTVPADITAEATGANGATVSYMGVTATDDVDGPLTATCSKASGTVFPHRAPPRSPAQRPTRRATRATTPSP